MERFMRPIPGIGKRRFRFPPETTRGWVVIGLLVFSFVFSYVWENLHVSELTREVYKSRNEVEKLQSAANLLEISLGEKLSRVSVEPLAFSMFGLSEPELTQIVDLPGDIIDRERPTEHPATGLLAAAQRKITEFLFVPAGARARQK
ncbi:MAG: hypothetical protein QME66_00160 [Candidatus Eisenbacteria bacterium]|nr:hypothetical protein [Candidatus Eisenbacteria bacterium]